MSSAAPPIRYGGQALIEGVMIRGSTAWAYALRHPDGTIVLEGAPHHAPVGWRTRPLLRGLATLGTTFRVGYRTMIEAIQVNTIGERRRLPAWYLPMAWSIAIAIGLFVFVAVPLLATGRPLDLHADLPTRLREGALKSSLFAGYTVCITHLPRLKRMFSYHGAEHMAIHAFEAGEPLSPESVARFNPAHPRCGTCFLVILFLLDTLLLAALPRFGVGIDLALRVAALPLIAAVAYEALRWGSTRRGLSALLTRLGLFTQRLTTARPDAGQIEVAIAALAYCRALEGYERDPSTPPLPTRKLPPTR